MNILLVCTGNTCRSPMAEGIFCYKLAEKLGCGIDQLSEKGYKVDSAGTIGLAGTKASTEAIESCKKIGIDISNHRSQALSVQKIADSDIIFALSRGHIENILYMAPEAEHKVVLLGYDTEVPDPIGQSQEVYDKCLELIEESVNIRISELVK